jgi:hypothetical protein
MGFASAQPILWLRPTSMFLINLERRIRGTEIKPVESTSTETSR